MPTPRPWAARVLRFLALGALAAALPGAAWRDETLPDDAITAPAPGLDPAAPPSAWVLTEGDAAPESLRHLTVDLAPWTGEDRVLDVWYDLEAALEPRTTRTVRAAPAWLVATRLVLGEVGNGRLAKGRWGTVEAVGVLQTVFNRLDEDTWNPLGIPNLGGFPGCDAPHDDLDAAFVSCAEPAQYFGLTKARGLRPARYGRDATVLEAVDRAVAAWVLARHVRVDDLTGGATMYVHRCGGLAYGDSTPHCDRDPTTPDTRGANPHTGPIVFKRPIDFHPTRRFYTVTLSAVVDYEPGDAPVAPLSVASYLYARALDPTARDAALMADLATLDALHAARVALRDGQDG